jgi:hypothetical protein
MDYRSGNVGASGSGAATDQDADQRAREIRSDIERTREDLSETVDAIQEKLRPSNVVASAASATTEKVKDMAYSAAETAEEWWDASGGTGLVDRVRNNPVPAVLAGVGLAWLVMSNGENRRGRRPGPSVDRRPEADRWNSTSGRSITSQPGMAQARTAVRRYGRRVESMVRTYPLAVGAAAAILGASLGMAVPETEQENEWLGDARETAVRRAQEAATGAVDRVKDAAADVVTRAAIGD